MKTLAIILTSLVKAFFMMFFLAIAGIAGALAGLVKVFLELFTDYE